MFLTRLYAGTPYALAREPDRSERLSVRVEAEGETALETLLERLA
jgi:hypothetical protein